MKSDETEEAVLLCSACGQSASHRLVYAGRLLMHSECENCGHVVRYPRESVRDEYRADLTQRLRTKPRRLINRAAEHPVEFLLALPKAAFRQPVKLFKEFRTVKE